MSVKKNVVEPRQNVVLNIVFASVDLSDTADLAIAVYAIILWVLYYKDGPFNILKTK